VRLRRRLHVLRDLVVELALDFFLSEKRAKSAGDRPQERHGASDSLRLEQPRDRARAALPFARLGL
jgi:hypothetical protein